MKNVYLFIILLLSINLRVAAQSPNAVNYQAAIRDANGTILASQPATLKLSIREGSANGTVVYSEEHTATTTAQGIVNLKIGTGTNTTGSFSSINWEGNQHFLKVELQQGSTFVTMGTNELVSVPYAFYTNAAAKAGKADTATYTNTATHAQTATHSDTAIIATGMKLDDLTDVSASSPVTGQVLLWNGTSWAPANSGSSWNLLGNSNTIPAENFLGTIDSNDLVIRTNNTQRARVFAAGSVLMGDSLTGPGNKVIWNRQKAAFRAGMIDRTATTLPPNFWDVDSLGIGSFAGGINTKAKGMGATAFGQNTVAVGDYSLAVGDGAEARGSGSISLGGGTATGQFALALGPGQDPRNGAHATEATGTYAFALCGGRATGRYSISGGQSSIASGESSTALGYVARARGESSLALGGGKANGVGSIAMCGGNGNGTAEGDNSIVFGESYAYGASSIAMGYSAVAMGEMSTAMGYSTAANGTNATAMGFLTVANGTSSLVIGQCNDTVVTPQTDYTATAATPLFIIGNGADYDHPSNAFTVYYTGNATLAGTLTQNSDRRLKKDIQSLNNSLDNVQKMEGVSYHWNGINNHDTAQLQFGLIAQELEAIYPHLVTKEGNGYKSINYIGLVPVLIEAIKELKSENSSLKADNSTIRSENAAINQRLDKVMSLLEGNNAELLSSKK